MPRQSRTVKNNLLASRRSGLTSAGMVDIHFHGAYGIDLMRAQEPELDHLSALLWADGIAAFCPTTLSASSGDLLQAVETLGAWVRKLQTEWHPDPARDPRAYPLGLHLEGPFINSGACGAHPAEVIRPLQFRELNALWDASHKTIKILTIAPETLSTADLKRLVKWASKRRVVLSLGHSRASQEEASAAIDLGFSGVTHAWNALPAFHHRDPGPLGACIGNPKAYLELIIDQVHVSQKVLRWTVELHTAQKGKICFVSDCAPAAATRPSGEHEWVSFGPVKCRFENGASRLPGGGLAGGGLLLSEAYARWVGTEAGETGKSIKTTLLNSIEYVSDSPLKALGFAPRRFAKRRIQWSISSKGAISLMRTKMRKRQ